LSKCSNEDDECLLLLLSSVTIDLRAADADTFPNSAGSGVALVTDVSSGRIAAGLAGSGGGTNRFWLGDDDDDDVEGGGSFCDGWDNSDPTSPPSECDDSAGSLLVDDVGWLDPGFFHNRYTLWIAGAFGLSSVGSGVGATYPML